jgi:hypothetical protein
MWWILHRKNPGMKPSSGPPNYIVSSTCPARFREAVLKLLSPEDVEKLDTGESAYEILITNRVTKEVAGFGKQKEEDLK